MASTLSSTHRVVCKFWKTGSCNRGKHCKFIHPWKPCENFARGECKFGDKCTFLHVVAEIKPQVQVESEPGMPEIKSPTLTKNVLVVRKGVEYTKECPRYKAGEPCDEDKCTLAHPLTADQYEILSFHEIPYSEEEEEQISSESKVDFDTMDVMAVFVGATSKKDAALPMKALGYICRLRGDYNVDVMDARDINLVYVTKSDVIPYRGSASDYKRLYEFLSEREDHIDECVAVGISPYDTMYSEMIHPMYTQFCYPVD